MESVLLKAKFGKIKAQANTGSILTDKRGCQTVKVMATELYYIRATFPPLRHSFIQRHHCIHRLINQVYTKDQALCYSLPHDMVAARIKYCDLRNISLGCVTHCQSIGRVERSSLRDRLFTLRLPALSFMQNKCAC